METAEESLRVFQCGALFSLDSKVGTVVPVIEMGNPGCQKIDNAPEFTVSKWRTGISNPDVSLL